MKARIERTETFPGEYANVTVSVELDAEPGQHIREVLAIASVHVADQLRVERARRRRLGAWGEEQQPLEAFEGQPA